MDGDELARIRQAEEDTDDGPYSDELDGGESRSYRISRYCLTTKSSASEIGPDRGKIFFKVTHFLMPFLSPLIAMGRDAALDRADQERTTKSPK